MNKLKRVAKTRKGNLCANMQAGIYANICASMDSGKMDTGKMDSGKMDTGKMDIATKFVAKRSTRCVLLLACLLLGANIQLAKAQEVTKEVTQKVGAAEQRQRLKRSSDCSPADASYFVEQKAQALLKQIQKKQAEQKAQILSQKSSQESLQKSPQERTRQKKYKKKYTEILKQAFAFETVARTLVGPYWRKMSAQQRNEYTALISDILNISISNTIYTLQVKSYSLEGASSLGKDFAVRLQVNLEQANLENEAIPVVWRVRCFQDESLENKSLENKSLENKSLGKNMGIVDLLFRNVSVIAGKRAEMTALLSKRGIAEFLMLLKDERDRIAQR